MDKLVTNKNIVLVGHSPNIFKTKRDIDAYDCVVRFNFGAPSPEYSEYIGKRTDIWFHWDGHNYDPEEEKFKAKYRIGYNDYPRVLFAQLRIEQEQLKAPSMGMLAYYYLLRYNPKTVSLYGFDFFKTADFTNTLEVQQQHTRENGCHDFWKEEEWFWRTKPEFVKFYDENNKEVKQMVTTKEAKRIQNKAILEPKTSKAVLCKACGYDKNINRSRCFNCNASL